MQRTFVAVALVSITAACTDARKPRTESGSQAIVNGTAVPAGESLATVYLDLGGGSCSGTLVSPKVVLTAKHCTEGVGPSSVWVMFGHIANDDGTWIQAVAIDNHPSTDISMIEMAEPGPTDPIPLWEDAYTQETVGTPVRIVGFGVTGEWQSDSGRKREGMTELYDYDGEVMYVGATGSKTCYGDSGGSAYMSKDGVEHVAGVISFGTDICEEGLSGQMRVDVNVEWIRDFIEEHDPQPVEPDAGVPAADAAPDPAGDPDAGPGGGGGGDDDPDDPGDATGGCAGQNGASGLALLLVIAGGVIHLERSRRRDRQ